MEYWGLGNWDSGPLEKFVFDLGGSILNHENPPLKKHSIIPFARQKHLTS
jgi:hypothetical protein